MSEHSHHEHPHTSADQAEKKPEVVATAADVDYIDLNVRPDPTEQKSEPEVTQVQLESSVQETEPVLGKRNPQNVTLDAPASVVDANRPEDERFVGMPGDTAERTAKLIGAMPNVDVTASEPGDLWARTIRKAFPMIAYDDMFNRTLEDPAADFFQSMEFAGRRMGAAEGRFQASKNQVFNGEEATMRIISHLGLGTTWSVGLYNTGIWVTFKPPAEEDLVELYRQLTSDQIKMGRASYGLAYANTTVYIVDRLCRFACQFIYRINADQAEIGANNILEHMKAQDIFSFLWGFACTMFPRGFAYSRACTNNPDKCQFVINEILNLRKLQLINRNALTEKQKAHMAEFRGSIDKMKIKDLKAYEAEMIRAQNRSFTCNEGKENAIVFTLRSPTAAEYIQTGYRWVEDMVATVEQALGSDSSVEDKNKQIDLRSRATIMREYSHWVAGIEFGENNKIDDRTTIEATLGDISADADIREDFLEQVKKFIEHSSVTVIGIPTYDCPNCGQPNEGAITYPHRSTMIPIDVVQLFFVLLSQKQAELEAR